MSTRTAEKVHGHEERALATSDLLHAGRGSLGCQPFRGRSRWQLEVTATAEVRVLVCEHGALRAEELALWHEGADVAVLVQSDREPPGVFAERVQRRLEIIGSSGRRVEQATIAVNRGQGEHALRVRASIARGILRIMHDTPLIELAFVAASSGGAQRGELLALVESLLSDACGKRPSMRVCFEEARSAESARGAED